MHNWGLEGCTEHHHHIYPLLYRHLTSDDGLATYKLQPAPIATLKTTPVFLKSQQQLNQHFNPYPSAMTSKPSSKSSSIMKSSFDTINEYSVSMTSKPRHGTPEKEDGGILPEKQDGGHGSNTQEDVMASKIAAKNKMAASCSSDQSPQRPARISTGSLPSYDE